MPVQGNVLDEKWALKKIEKFGDWPELASAMADAGGFRRITVDNAFRIRGDGRSIGYKEMRAIMGKVDEMLPDYMFEGLGK